jgi:SM-20-related protein
MRACSATEEEGAMDRLDLAAFRATPLTREPFPYLIVPRFIKPAALTAINADYPTIDCPGSFPVSGLTFGPGFQYLLDDLRGPAFRSACEEKFGIDLSGRASMITARGRCGTRDGNIHTDAASKILTVLIYMNPTWEQSGGCLRLLRSGHDLDDVLVEIPPIEGTLLVFRRTDNSWHGHKPFLGPRRVIQFNWVTTHGVERREVLRHRVSAWMKKTLALFRRSA